MRIFATVAERADNSKWDLIAGPNSDFVAQDKLLDELSASKGEMKSGKSIVRYHKAVISDIIQGARRRRSF